MPYEMHDDVDTPPDDAVALWRYMYFTKFVSMLEDRAIHFAQLSQLAQDDPFEGSLSQPIIEAFANAAKREGLSAVDIERRVRTTLGVYGMARTLLYANCWHQNTIESAAMWKLYLQSGEGIAIKSSIGRLKASFAKSDRAVHIGKVLYMNYDSDVTPTHNVIGLGLLKRSSFEHEREIRALLFENNGPKGIKVQVEMETLVESIYVAPTAPFWLKSLVDSVVLRYELVIPVLQSALSQRALY